LLIFLWKKGYIASLYIDDARQRTIPYMYTLVCYGFWAYFLRITMRMPMFMMLIVIGVMVALLVVTLINYKWKISAHLTGIGGLLGGICSFAINYSIYPIKIIILVVLLSLLLMYARLFLHAHTPLQVVCGFLLGLTCTFIPNYLITTYA
jgi:membrane-associated phospholipid phosphatase